MKSLVSSIKHIGFLTIALTAALMANFAFGAWSNPPSAPTADNVAAPINVGADAQVKDGDLGTDSLTVDGNLYIDSGAPTIELIDNDGITMWFRNQNNSMYLLADRDGGGDTSGDIPWPVDFHVGADGSEDYVRFSNRLLANEYCNRFGDNCMQVSEMRLPSCLQGQILVAGVGGVWECNNQPSPVNPPPPPQLEYLSCPAQAVSWSDGGSTCTSNLTAQPHETTLFAQFYGGSESGHATYQCLDGGWIEQAGSTCRDTPEGPGGLGGLGGFGG